MAQPEYENLASLRAALTSEDADRRSGAYGHVFEAGADPQSVMANDVSDETRQKLADADVIPADEERTPGSVRWQQMLDELKAIRQALETDGGTA